MRQVFFLLVSAMLAAFSLSWASIEENPGEDSIYLVPNEIQLPLNESTPERQIFAKITLRKCCEMVASTDQEQRGSKLIFSIKINKISEAGCLLEQGEEIPLDLKIVTPDFSDSKYLGIYFRQDEDDLKYFGSVSSLASSEL